MEGKKPFWCRIGIHTYQIQDVQVAPQGYAVLFGVDEGKPVVVWKCRCCGKEKLKAW